MQYTYELRDRSINTLSSILDEMEEALSGHVFLDKGAGPIESSYSIMYRMPTMLVVELFGVSEMEIRAFRKRIFHSKGIPDTVPIYIFSKLNLKTPVFIFVGHTKKSSDQMKTVVSSCAIG